MSELPAVASNVAFNSTVSLHNDRSSQNLYLHTYFAHHGSDLPLHFISICNRDLVTTGFGGMKPSRHTCRCQCPSRKQTYISEVFGDSSFWKTSLHHHCRRSLNKICALPSALPNFHLSRPSPELDRSLLLPCSTLQS